MTWQAYHHYETYRARVSAEMQRLYGITWEEACGDDQPLIRAREVERSPTEFVEWWGERYGLTVRDHLSSGTDW